MPQAVPSDGKMPSPRMVEFCALTQVGRLPPPGNTQLLSLWSKSSVFCSAITSGRSTCSPTSHKMPKSARKLITSFVMPYFRSLMSSVPIAD